MKNRSIVLAALILAALPLAAGAQAALAVSRTPASVDGVLSDKEYTVVREAGGMTIGLTRTADTLYIGVSAPTTGWVAAGVGSRRMDGAVIYIGFATADGSQLKVQKGAGHRHGDLETSAPRAYAVKEAAGRTVLEVALDVGTFITEGQSALDLVAAMGGADSFLSMHRARAGVTVDLK